jgi:hypothetical protein
VFLIETHGFFVLAERHFWIATAQRTRLAMTNANYSRRARRPGVPPKGENNEKQI